MLVFVNVQDQMRARAGASVTRAMCGGWTKRLQRRQALHHLRRAWSAPRDRHDHAVTTTDAHGFVERDLSADSAARAEHARIGYRGVPVIRAGESIIYGFREQALGKLLGIS